MTSRLVKRHLSLCLVLVMLLTAMLPVSVFATGSNDESSAASGGNAAATTMISDYATFLSCFKVLEGYAQTYAEENTGEDANALIINYIRTGVERYTSGTWEMVCGKENTAFTAYVSEQDAANGTSASALKRMTAEAVAAHPDSILARVVAENDGHVSGQSAFIAARQGDPVGQRICDEYVGYLACGIVNVVNVFQPDALAIGGGVSNEADEQLLLPVQRCVERESIPCAKNRRTRIVKAELGNQAGIIGAALLGKNKRI